MAPLSNSLMALSFAVNAAAQSFGATPLMGYNSYNQLACSPSESSMTTAINSIVDRGFAAVGYKYFQIDCGWAARDGRRNATSGALAIDLNRFPNGLQGLSNLARSKGLKWSMYSDAGVRMCDTQVPSPVLGSLGFETQDAEFFGKLGTEYLKYDNCYVDGPNADQNAPKDPRTDFPSRFSTMWNALKNVGIKGLLICQWGTPYSSSTGLQGPVTWTKGISTSFRLSDDIATGWSHTYRIYNQAIYIANTGLTGPGHFADADLLEVGNRDMTIDEQATHFAAWALFKSSLFISTDVPALSDAAVKILQNRDIIAINQDALGKPVTLVQRWTADRDLLAGPLSNGDRAVMVVDLSNSARTLSVNFADLGIASANVKDLWTGATATGVSSYSRSVAAHGSLVLRLSNIRTSTTTAPKLNYVSASTGSLASGAAISACNGCASTNKVGFIGGGNRGVLTLSNIRTSQATQAVRFDYINGEVGYLGGNLPNERLASISVNGGAAKTVAFPLSGYDWVKDVAKDYKVELSGFNTNGPNTITISGVGTAFAPDLDQLGFVA